MNEILDFLKKAGTYFIATDEDGQPRVRPFGTVNEFEGKLYIQTGKIKDIAKQVAKNPKFELCAMNDGDWVRVSGELVEDDRREARKSMLDAYPELRSMYNEDDGNTVVYYIKNGNAVFSSFTKPKKEIKF